jgi:uncharacterized protein (DUF58 family)
MDRLFVKKFIEERELTIVLAVDISASLDFATAGDGLKRDLAARFALAIALSAMANQDRVGLFLFTDGPELFVPPRRGRSHILGLIRQLLTIKPKGRRTDPEAALGALSRLLKPSATLFVCSDFLDFDCSSMKRLAQAHDVVAVSLTDPAEERLLDWGLVEFADPETGRTLVIDTSKPKLREEYHALMLAKQKKRQAAFRALGIDEIALRTDTPYWRELVGFFRRRAGRRVRRTSSG